MGAGRLRLPRVIAPSFGDIFFNNSLQERLPADRARRRRRSTACSTTSRRPRLPAGHRPARSRRWRRPTGRSVFRFEIDPFRKHCLLERPRRDRPHAAPRRQDPSLRGKAPRRAAVAVLGMSGVEDRRPAGRRHRPRDHRAGGAGAARAGAARRRVRARRGAGRRRGLRRGTAIRCRRRRWRSPRTPTRSCSARSAARSTTRSSAAMRPEQAILGLRKELGLFANLRPATLFPELADASTLKPEVVVGPRHPDRARADRRHLLRRAARHPHQRGGRARRLQHHALHRAGDPPHRARRLPGGAQARQASSARSTRPTCSRPRSSGATW